MIAAGRADGPSRQDQPAGSRLGVEAAWVFAAGLVLAVVLLLPGSLRLATHLPDDGDALQGVWILWWGATHLADGLPALLDGNVYHPHPRALLFSEPLLTQAALAAPLLGLTENRVLVVNLVMLASLALNAASFHLLARSLGASVDASAAVSVLYAFNTYVLGQLARLQLLGLAWLPLALWALLRLARTGRVRNAWAFALFLVLLGFACLYYLAFSALVLAVVLPVALWSSQDLRRPRAAAHLAAAAAAAAAVLAPLAWQYRALFDRYGFSAEREPFHLRRFLVPNSGTLLYPDPKEPGDVFLGYGALLLAVVGLVSLGRRGPLERRLTTAIAASALAAALIAPWPEWRLGPLQAPAPLALLGTIEPFSRIRDSARLAAVVFLGLGVLVVPAVDRLLGPLRGIRRAAAALALSAVLLAEHWTPGFRGVEVPVPPPAYAWLAARPGPAVVAELPPRPFHLVRLTALEAYFSTFHGHRVLFGRPSFFPPAMEVIQWELRNFPDATSLALLRGLGVRWAVVHPERWGEDRRRQQRRLEERADRLPVVASFPDDPGPVWARYELGGERIHEVLPAADEREPRRCLCEELPRDAYRLTGNGATPPALAADGRRDTRWTTGAGQEEGPFYLEVRFAHPRRPVRVEVEAAFPYGEFARELEITGHLGPEAFRVGPRADPWYTPVLVRQLAEDPARARLRYDLDARTVDRLRLVAGGYRGGLAWSVPEIHVYEGELLED